MNQNVRCKVACEWLDGGVTLRYSESRDWSSEEDALSYAAGCHRSGKYSSIRVRYSRKRMGRWQNAGSVAYPPNSARQRRREPLKTMDNTENTKQPEARRSLHAVVGRRVVTISVAGVTNNASTQCNWITTAVCDDGSMWWLRDNDAEWRELPPIPQPPNTILSDSDNTHKPT